MKLVLVLVSSLVAMVVSAPQQNPKDAIIVKSESENIGLDGYKFAYETSDGVSRSEEGVLKNVGAENEAMEVRGVVSWVGADGVPYKLEYVADENGFQPIGAHLPH